MRERHEQHAFNFLDPSSWKRNTNRPQGTNTALNNQEGLWGDFMELFSLESEKTSFPKIVARKV